MGKLYQRLKAVDKLDEAKLNANIDAHYTAMEAAVTVRAIKDLAKKIPSKHLKRVPVTRLINPISWQDKVQMSAIKFLPGWVIGAGCYTISVIKDAGLDGVLTAGTDIAAAGGVGGAALAVYKFLREYKKDRTLEKDVREPLRRIENFEACKNLEFLSMIFSSVKMLATLGGLNTTEALKQVSLHLNTLGKLPFEVSEFLVTIGQCLEDGSAGGNRLTAEEIGVIIEQAADIKAAYLAVVNAWSSR